MTDIKLDDHKTETATSATNDQVWQFREALKPHGRSSSPFIEDSLDVQHQPFGPKSPPWDGKKSVFSQWEMGCYWRNVFFFKWKTDWPTFSAA